MVSLISVDKRDVVARHILSLTIFTVIPFFLDKVRFTGYMLPHPLIHLVRLKLQTNSSTVSPVEVLSSAIEDLGNETDYLTEKATDAITKWKKENAAGGMDQF